MDETDGETVGFGFNNEAARTTEKASTEIVDERLSDERQKYVLIPFFIASRSARQSYLLVRRAG